MYRARQQSVWASSTQGGQAGWSPQGGQDGQEAAGDANPVETGGAVTRCLHRPRPRLRTRRTLGSGGLKGGYRTVPYLPSTAATDGRGCHPSRRRHSSERRRSCSYLCVRQDIYYNICHTLYKVLTVSLYAHCSVHLALIIINTKYVLLSLIICIAGLNALPYVCVLNKQHLA